MPMPDHRGDHLKKPVVLLAAVAMQACLGGIYAWSAFVPQLQKSFGYSSTQTQLIFGTCVCVFSFLVFLTGRWQDRFGPRPMALASGLCVGAAYLLAGGTGRSFMPLWLSAGVLGGLGIALGYVCPIATAVKWFPRHAGLVAGLAVAGYGGGAIILSAIVETLLGQGWNILDIFTTVGLLYGPIIMLSGLGLFLPERQHLHTAEPIPILRVLTQRRFWMLFTAMFCLTMPGLAIIGSIKPLGLWFSLGPVTAAAAVGALAVGNASGRVLWGLAHDHLGGRSAVLGALAMMMVAVLAIWVSSLAGAAFLAAAVFLGFCYGGAFSILPARVSHIYGPGVVGGVYGLVLFAQGLAALAGPAVMGGSFDLFADYRPGLVIAAVIAAAGLLGCALLGRRR